MKDLFSAAVAVLRRKLYSAFVVLMAICFIVDSSAQSVTPNLNLNTPPIHSFNWGLALNQDFVMIDGILGGTTTKLPQNFWTLNMATSTLFGALKLALGTVNTTAENVANKGVANGYAPLDGAGLVPVANIPAGTSVDATARTAAAAAQTTANGACPTAGCVFTGIPTTSLTPTTSQQLATVGYVLAHSAVLPNSLTVVATDGSGNPGNATRNGIESALGYNPLPSDGTVSLTSPVANGGCGMIADGNLDIPGGLGIGFPVPTGTNNYPAWVACQTAHPGATFSGAGKFTFMTAPHISSGAIVGKGMCYNGTTILGNGCFGHTQTTFIAPQGVDGLVIDGQDVEVTNLNIVGSNPFALNFGSRDLSKLRLPAGQYMSFWQYAAVSPFPTDANRTSNVVRIPIVNQYYLADNAAVQIIGMAPNSLNGVHRITRGSSPDVNSRMTFVYPGSNLTNTQMGTGVGYIGVDTPGTGYTTCTATITGGGGTGATASCTASGGAVIAVTTTNAGATPFTSQPTVTITGPGTGATAHAINQAATGPWSGMLIQPATTSPYNDDGIRITAGVKAKIHNVSVSNHSRSCIAADGSSNADDVQIKDYWTSGCGLSGTELGLGGDTSAASIEHGNNYQNGIAGMLIGDFLGSMIGWPQHSYNFGGAALASGGTATAYTSCVLVNHIGTCHQVAHGLAQGNAIVFAGSSVSSLNVAAGTASAFVTGVSGPDDFTFEMPDSVADTTITGGTIRPAAQDEFYNLVGIQGGAYIHGIKGAAGTTLYVHPYIEGAQTGGQAAGTDGFFSGSALIVAPHFGDQIAGNPGIINQDPIFGMSFYSSQHIFVGGTVHWKPYGAYPISQGAPNSFANADTGYGDLTNGYLSWVGGYGSSGAGGPFFKMPTTNFISNYCLKNNGGQLFEQACLKGAPFLLNYMSTNFDEQPDHTNLSGTTPAITTTGTGWSSSGGSAFQYFQAHAEASLVGCCTSIDVGKKDVTVTTTLIRAPIGVASFLVRYTDNSNYVVLNISTSTISIVDVVAGTPTTVATASAPASVLGTSSITINGKAVSALVNGAMLSGNLPGGSTNLTATKIAIGDTLGGTQIGSIFVNGIPLTGQPSGNTTTFATVSGGVVNGHMAVYDTNGNIIDGGAPSGGSGGALNTCRAQNYTAGGTITQYSLVIINTSAQMATAGVGGGGVYGIAQTAATVGNPVPVCIDGVSSLVMDGTTVVGNIISPSTTTGGQGHDTTQTSRNSIGYQSGVVGDAVTACSGVGCTATVSLEGINRVGRQLPSTLVKTGQANDFGAGNQQKVTADSTNAGLLFGGTTVDPSSTTVGQMWYRSDLGQVSIRGISSVLRLMATTGSGPITVTGPNTGTAPSNPPSGSNTGYYTTGGVWTVIDNTGTVTSNAVVPLTGATAGSHVAWIGSDGVQHLVADSGGGVALSNTSPWTAQQPFSAGFLGSGVRSVTTASDTLLASDSSGAVRYSFATTITLTVPQAGTTGFGAGYFVLLKNTGVGNLVITPTTSTIEGNATSTLATGQTTLIYSDGTNYREFGGKGAATNVANTWTFRQTYQGGNLWMQAVNTQTTGSPYTMLVSDEARLLLINSASAYAVTLPVASTAGFTSGSFFYVSNKGAGTVTITPTTSTINAGATLVLTTNQSALILSDGTNYYALTNSSGGTTYTGGKDIAVNGTVIDLTPQKVMLTTQAGDALTTGTGPFATNYTTSANYLTAGDVIDIYASGHVTTGAAGSQFFDPNLRAGSTVLTTAAGQFVGASANVGWSYSAKCIVRTIVTTTATLWCHASTSVGAAGSLGTNESTETAAVTIDPTATQQFQLGVSTTITATNTWTMNMFTVEIKK